MRLSVKFYLSPLLLVFITACAMAIGQPIARVQFVHTYSYPGNTVTFPGNNAAGNAIVVMASWYAAPGTPTISDTRGNTYTMLPALTGGGAGNGEQTSILIWYALNIGAGVNTVTISGAGIDAGITAVEYSGVATSAAIGITSTLPYFGGTPTTTPTSSTFTPSAGSLLFVAFADETNPQNSIAAGSGYNLIQGDGNHVDIEEDTVNSSAAPQTASISVNFATWSWAMYVVELLPSGRSSTPPIGTVLWSNPGDGSGVAKIIPAVPSATGVADVFALQNDGTVMAVTSDGTTAWTASVNPQGGPLSVLPDFQGGLVVCNGSTNSIWKLDGITGQAYPAYAPNPNNTQVICANGGLAVHTDGTIFALPYTNVNGNYEAFTVIGIDPMAGAVKFTAPLPGGGQFNGPLFASAVIVSGDGDAYACYIQETQTGPGITGFTQVSAMQVSSAGAFQSIPITQLPYEVLGIQLSLMTNADTGILISSNNGNNANTGPFMAITNRTSVSLVSGPTVPGQNTGPGGAVVPVLQRQDGSFVGTVGVGAGGNNPQTNMVAFNASGNVLWMVPNESPQIATADGGVIGKSGTKYDQNGNPTGPSGLGANPTPGWLGNVLGTTYALQSGVVEDIAAPSTNYATTFAAFEGGNGSGQGTAISQTISNQPQTGQKQLPNLSSPVCKAPHATCGNINAIELLTPFSPAYIFQNYIQTFAPVSANALPKNTIQTFSTPSGSPINVTGPGQILKISLSGFPGVLQPPFQIMTERVDPVTNTISVVTLAGHPLAGWRYWRVYSIGTNDVVIETGAYDSPGPGPVNYVGYYVTIGTIKQAWQQYMQYFQVVLGAAQGNHLRNSLSGIPLIDLSPYNGPLVNGYWDWSGNFTSYILNNVCQSTVCN